MSLLVTVKRRLKKICKSEQPYLVLLSLSCLFPLIQDPYFYYGNFIDCDTTRYFGLNVSLDTNKFFENHYMDDRLPALIPVHYLYRFFGMYWGHFLNYFLTYSIFILGLNLALKQFFDKNTRWLTLVVAACSPLLLGTLSLDYTASKAEMYSIYSLAFMGVAFNSKKKKYFYYFLAAFFFGSSLHSNFKYIMYLSFIPILYFTDLNPMKFSYQSFWRFLAAAMSGYIVMLLVFGLLNVVMLDGYFLFFRDLYVQFVKNEAVYRLDFYSRLRETPLMIYFIVLFVWSCLHFLKNKKMDGYIVSVWSMFLLNLIYIFCGGNYFVPQRSSAFNILFFFVFPAFIVRPYIAKNVNIKFLPIFLIWGLCITMIKYINLQFYIAEYFGYYAILVYVLVAITLYLSPRYIKWKPAVYMYLILSIILLCVIRPDNRGNGSWFQNLGESDKRFQNYKIQYDAGLYLKKYKFQRNPYFFFDFADSPKGESIAISYNGCTAHLKIFHHSFKGLPSSEKNWAQGDLSEFRMQISNKKEKQWLITSGDRLRYENFLRDNIINNDIKKIGFIESYRYGDNDSEVFHIYLIEQK